jgi:iron complex outermembrane recepter protein
VTAAIFCPVTNAEAREAGSQQIDISATDLSAAIAELSRKAHVSIGTAGSLPQLRTSPIHGEMTAGEALTRLLSGSGYTARRVGGTAWRIEPLPRTRPVKVKIAPSFIPPAAPIIPQQIIESPPIIVTGTKRSRPLNELPLAISVVSLSADNKAATSRDTAKIAASMEGLALTGLGPGRNRLAIRGVADSSFNGESQSTVAVLLDDARLTYSAPDPNIRLVDVERVEVIKGPQGSLFGSGALGGIYHIVSRRADVNRFELEASAGTETVAHGGIGYSGSVIANVPVVSGTAALGLG